MHHILTVAADGLDGMQNGELLKDASGLKFLLWNSRCDPLKEGTGVALAQVVSVQHFMEIDLGTCTRCSHRPTFWGSWFIIPKHKSKWQAWT